MWLTNEDRHWFHEGTHLTAYEKLGSHPVEGGTHFCVWAPNTDGVSVVGDWNGWTHGKTPMTRASDLGLWHAFVDGVKPGAMYKYAIKGMEKIDPYARAFEEPPRTASIVSDLAYEWRDEAWMEARASVDTHKRPMSIYEVHLGSWQREGRGFLGYRELAKRLADYCSKMRFTHVELLPIMEHPFYGSWGYQTLGYFAPSRRYGAPQDFMAFVDVLHAAGIGVILDWVPSHFPTDAHGLAMYDGTHLYEHADPRQGFHPDWKSAIFNYGRDEVQTFLISSALFWMDKYHVDGLRVDAVASMLYLDYSRKEGEWIPNKHGGRENLEAIAFMQRLNKACYERFPGVQMIAEESTAWPSVSKPVGQGGLGFGFKWDMGWMHDTLKFFARDPIYRGHHLNELTFRSLYAFTESFVLSLSHDEVVHGKGSLLSKMPGSDEQRLASLKTLYGYMWGQSGKKLLFMGCELGQWTEWSHEQSLDWSMLDRHRGLVDWIRDLNKLYRDTPALQADDKFEWIDAGDRAAAVMSFHRCGEVVVIMNLTPVERVGYRIGVPSAGSWREALNSDASVYGGRGAGNMGRVLAEAKPLHGQPASAAFMLPAMSALFLVKE